MDIFSSNHNAFDITGSFPNPGLLAGYLAIGLVMATCICVDFYREQDHRWMLPATCAFPVIVALYYADSRAVYLSMAVSLMIWSVHFFTRTWKKYRQACIAAGGFYCSFYYPSISIAWTPRTHAYWCGKLPRE